MTVISHMIARLLATGQPQRLTKQHLRQFHAEFARLVAPQIDAIRRRRCDQS